MPPKICRTADNSHRSICLTNHVLTPITTSTLEECAKNGISFVNNEANECPNIQRNAECLRRNEGRTWNAGTLLLRKSDSQYSSIASLPDGCVGVLYDCWKDNHYQPPFTIVTPGDIQIGEKLEMMPHASVLTRARVRTGVTRLIDPLPTSHEPSISNSSRAAE